MLHRSVYDFLVDTDNWSLTNNNKRSSQFAVNKWPHYNTYLSVNTTGERVLWSVQWNGRPTNCVQLRHNIKSLASCHIVWQLITIIHMLELGDITGSGRLLLDQSAVSAAITVCSRTLITIAVVKCGVLCQLQFCTVQQFTLTRNCSQTSHLQQASNNNKHRFNGLFSRTTWVSRHQEGQTNLILMKQEMTRWQWHQLDDMQIICTSLHTDNHASTSSFNLFYRPDALPDTQLTASKHWRPPVSDPSFKQTFCFHHQSRPSSFIMLRLH